jgi:hypothetical protein
VVGDGQKGEVLVMQSVRCRYGILLGHEKPVNILDAIVESTSAVVTVDEIVLPRGGSEWELAGAIRPSSH